MTTSEFYKLKDLILNEEETYLSNMYESGLDEKVVHDNYIRIMALSALIEKIDNTFSPYKINTEEREVTE